MDKYLNPENTPINSERPEIAIDFDYLNEKASVSGYHIKNLSIDTAKIQDASITSAKIDNFSFNQGTGGTLTLGGTLNGNGLLVVKNSAGAAIVNVNNTGITVTGGSINVVNSAGSTIVDPIGLNSISNFQSGQIFDTSTYNTTSTNFTDLGSTTQTIIITRATKFFFYMFVLGLNTEYWNNGYYDEIELWDDILSTQLMNSFAQGIPYTGGALTTQQVTMQWIGSLAAGTHSMKMRYRTSNGSGTATITSAGWGYVQLGQ